MDDVYAYDEAVLEAKMLLTLKGYVVHTRRELFWLWITVVGISFYIGFLTNSLITAIKMLI